MKIKLKNNILLSYHLSYISIITFIIVEYIDLKVMKIIREMLTNNVSQIEC